MKKRDRLYLGLFTEDEEFLLKKNFPVFLAILAVLILLALAFMEMQAKAQEDYRDEHAKYHPTYKNWTIPGTKLSCCSSMDCRRIRAKWIPNISGQEGHWVVAVNDVWKRVPEERILDVPSPDGAAHVCANEYGDIICFRRPVAQAWLPNYESLLTLVLSLDSKLESPVPRGFLFGILCP